MEERLLMGDMSRALEAPERAAELGPREQARAWVLRASACRRTGRFEEAAQAWEQAQRLSTADSWTLARFTFWLIIRGRFEDALETACRAVRIAKSQQDDTDSHAARGHALWVCGDVDAALVDFAAAVERAPFNSPVQITCLVNLCVGMVCAPMGHHHPETVLEMAGKLRAIMGTRKLPRVRACLRWATGLAECASGRRKAGARDLFRARQSFLSLGDAATAAAVTLDYAMAAGRPAAPLLAEVVESTPADTEEQTRLVLEGLANGRAADRQQLAAMAVATTLRRRRQL